MNEKNGSESSFISEKSFIERVPKVTVTPGREPIVLRNLTIDVKIIGIMALTTYDMIFYNPNATILEGEFTMPLGDEQYVSAIALDINGKMRDGVIVEKDKARNTFEAIVRRRIDPALVEKMAGNLFKTRIYPFNPRNTRRIKITLEEPLGTEQDHYVYDLPLRFKQTLNFDLHVNFSPEKDREVPEIQSDLSRNFFWEKGSSRSWKPLKKKTTSWNFSQKNCFLDNYFHFDLPKTANHEIFTHWDHQETLFYANIPMAGAPKEKILPQKISLFWDASLSGEKRNINYEKILLSHYFAANPDVEVTFALFRLKSLEKKTFAVTKGNWSALHKEIESVIYEGATEFPPDLFDDISEGEIFLFSDGMETFGEKGFGKANVPVFAINSSKKYDRVNLVGIACKSGGNFINLNEQNVETALEKLTKKFIKFLDYTADSEEILDIYPHPGEEIRDNQAFWGILAGREAKILLSFGYSKDEITGTREIIVANPGENPALARFRARQRIRELELNPEKNRGEIIELAKNYSIVTDYTSLLVLESVHDYVQYDITPPEELLDEYKQLTASRAKKSFAPIAYNTDPIYIVEEAPMVMKDDRELYSSIDFVSSEQSLKLNRRYHESMVEPSFDYTTDIQDHNEKPAPYLKILQSVPDKKLLAVYRMIKIGYADQPFFYINAADEFARRNMPEQALLILSGAVEIHPEYKELLKAAAQKLLGFKEYGYAVFLFKRILKQYGEDPQIYKDLARALEEMNRLIA
ncbi:MAG: hypothetical protein LBQ96_07605 [Fusobacteriaceae bacterium]|jgi:hypothetical protein|nr:hypothetical protein [Fusobacteriaceae bacterium]